MIDSGTLVEVRPAMKKSKREHPVQTGTMSLSSVDLAFVAINMRKISNGRLLGNMGEKLPKQCMIITDQ